MNLAAVSVVKNEADIIEAFVRHTHRWVDHHLVFDHDSTDGTRGILGELVREGLPLTVFTDGALGNLQQIRSNRLTRLAATEWGADWILPLDADEFLTGADRPALEKNLAAFPPARPASLPLLNYHPTAVDDTAEINPVLRLRHCERQQGNARKIMVPGILALDPTVLVGKGSHALHRGSQAVPDLPLADEFHLAHFSLRSLGQQAARIVLAELQKLSRGRVHAGLDLHYRLSFQTLAENPGMFLETTRQPVDRLRLVPVTYQGGPLQYTAVVSEWARITSALLPYLEKLAVSHGELLDRVPPAAPGDPTDSPIRRLEAHELTATTFAGRRDAFAGFEALAGLDPLEGPVPEAFLPVFHWGVAPGTQLSISSSGERNARLAIEALTYSEGQKIAVELNGVLVHQHVFERTEQRERIACRLPLRAGDNRLDLRYSAFLQTDRDSRKLAVIYLSLHIT